MHCPRQLYLRGVCPVLNSELRYESSVFLSADELPIRFEESVGGLPGDWAHKKKRLTGAASVIVTAPTCPAMPVLTCSQAKLVPLHEFTQLLDVLIDLVESLFAHKCIQCILGPAVA